VAAAAVEESKRPREAEEDEKEGGEEKEDREDLRAKMGNGAQEDKGHQADIFFVCSAFEQTFEATCTEMSPVAVGPAKANPPGVLWRLAFVLHAY